MNKEIIITQIKAYVVKFGTGGHITLPKSMIGKQVIIKEVQE